MPGDYYPTGPFIRRLARDDAFELAREDFLLGFRERTARAYKADLEDFREWCERVGDDPMNPDSEIISRYRSSLVKRLYSPGSVLRHLAAVRGFLGHLQAR